MAWGEGALTMSASVAVAETNFGLNVPGKSNAVPAAGSEPMFNGDPWQLRSTTEPEGAIKLEMQIRRPVSRTGTVREVR
jgi:hypothetical protein